MDSSPINKNTQSFSNFRGSITNALFNRTTCFLVLFLFCAPKMLADTNVKIQGVAERTAFRHIGTNIIASYHRKSFFSCEFNDKERLIKWTTDQNDENQEYFISPQLQIGLVSSPVVIVTNQQTGGAISTGTNAITVILAHDSQPRNADTEVQMLAFAFFNSNETARAISQGFIAPWGNYLEPDIESCKIIPTYYDSAPRFMQRADIVWDMERWINYTNWFDPDGTRPVYAPATNNMVLGSYQVTKWLEFHGLSVPQTWGFKRFAVAVNKTFEIEAADFIATNVLSSEGPIEKPQIPLSATVYDFRAATRTNLALAIVYDTTNGAWMNENSSAFQKTAATKATEMSAALTLRWAGPPKKTVAGTPVRGISVMILLLAVSSPLIVILARSIRVRHHRSND